jgi:hypothetical protein
LMILEKSLDKPSIASLFAGSATASKHPNSFVKFV